MTVRELGPGQTFPSLPLILIGMGPSPAMTQGRLYGVKPEGTRDNQDAALRAFNFRIASPTIRVGSSD